jgi:hypothetical protein
MDNSHVYGSSVTLRQWHSRIRKGGARAALLLGALAVSSCVRSLCDGGACEETSSTAFLQPSSSSVPLATSAATSSASATLSSTAAAPSASASVPVSPMSCTDTIECKVGVCSKTAQICVECESSEDCRLSSANAVCDVVPGSPAQNRCVECLKDDDCAEGSKCDGSGTCGPCDSVERSEGFAGCDPGQVCLAGEIADENQCVECRDSSDCVGQVCELSNHTCAPCVAATSSGASDAAVAVDEGCGGDAPRCLAAITPEANSCVACLTHDDCSGELSTCDSVSHQCVACASEIDVTQTAQLDASVTSAQVDQGCGFATPRCLIVRGTANLEPSQSKDSGLSDASDAAWTAADSGPVQDAGQVETRECVECVTGADCATGVCDPSSHACVECQTSANCGLAGRARCDTSSGQCVECDAAVHSELGVNPDCEHLDGKDVCVAGACRECSGEFRAACGSNLCDERPPLDSTSSTSSTQFTCGDAKPASGFACKECVSDAQCQSNQACVLTTFLGAPVGYFCLYRQVGSEGKAVVPSCGAQTLRPYGDLLVTESVSGEAGTFCAPAKSTCPAIDDYRDKSCEVADDCGVPGVADATCLDSDQGRRCSPLCQTDADCTYDPANVTVCGDGSCTL